jgi:1-acyl-sn-glycerol-3-phosphate acyltransferase
MEPVYSSVIAFARSVFAGQGLKFTITGESNVPASGGAVMAINHIGYLDFTFAGLAARKSGRLVRFMAKQEVFGHRIAGPLMRGMRHIPVDRAAGAGSFRRAVADLRKGELLGVFPEGTISRSFELKEFKSGTVRMAAAAGVPILPTVIWGSQRIWTKGQPRRLGRTRIPIFVSIGEPFEVRRGDDAEQATKELIDRMSRLLNEVQQAYPPMDGSERHLIPARLGGTAPTLRQAAELDAAEASAREERIGTAGAE